MSMRALSRLAESLPPAIANDVIQYARSVQLSLPEIFRDARVREDPELGDQLVFLAGIRKLESAIASQYWILDNSLHLMKAESIDVVRIGSSEIAIGSDFHSGLQHVMRELEHILASEGVAEILMMRSYAEMLKGISDGR